MVAGAVFSALALIPLLVIPILALARLQDLAVDFLFGILAAAFGLDQGDDSPVLRFAISGLLGGSLFAVAYVALLVGTHMGTLVVLAIVGATIGLALTVAAGLGSEEPSDTLSQLRFWDDE